MTREERAVLNADMAKKIAAMSDKQFADFVVGLQVILALDESKTEEALQMYRSGIPIREVAGRYGVDFTEGRKPT